MTVVNLDIRKLTQLGSEATTATVVVEFVQGGASPVLVSGATVSFPERVELTVTGAIALDIPATGVVMAARWSIVVSGGSRLERWTLIPDTGPIDFGALQDVDPATLQPTTTVIQAWQNTIDQATAAKTGAETARTAAEAAANLALTGQFLGSTVNPNSVNADTLTTPGVYRVVTQVTVANNYPFMGFIGVIEVFSRQAGRETQIAYATNNNASDASRFMIRSSGTAGWSPWRAYTSQRIDQNAGRAIYTWDDLNNREQLIYGDTGWRDISSLLINGWILNASGILRIRRVGYQVSLVMANINGTAATNALAVAAIAGFAHAQGWINFTSGVKLGQAVAHRAADGLLAPGNPSVWNDTGGMRDVFTWSTIDAWPTTLPGSAVGTIPNT